MIVSDITAYKDKFSSSKTILDNALTATDITQIEYDTYYPVVDSLYTNNNNLLTSLSGTMGHKSAGNFTAIADVFDNPDKTMDEIVRSNNKYKVVEACAGDIINSASSLVDFSAFKDLLPAVPDFTDYLSIFSWVDTFADDFNQYFSDMENAISTVITSLGVVKDNVKQFISDVKTLANDIIQSSLIDSPCITNIGTEVLAYKSPESVALINQLKTGDKAQLISNKIDSFQII